MFQRLIPRQLVIGRHAAKMKTARKALQSCSTSFHYIAGTTSQSGYNATMNSYLHVLKDRVRSPLSSNVDVKRHQQRSLFSTAANTTTGDLPRSLNDDDPPIDIANIQGEFGSYIDEYERAKKDPSKFWSEAANELEWFEPPTIGLQKQTDKSYEWFPDGKINTCYNCLDVQINKYGRGSQTALIYDSPLTGAKQKYTYTELLDEVSKFASSLKNDLGVEVGDRVVIYMPMIPQAVIAMLACARIGAVHSVVFGGFASQELASRITDCNPKIVITASVGVEPTRIVEYKPLLEKALELATHNVEKTVVVQRENVHQPCDLGPNDISYTELMENNSNDGIDAIPLPSTHPHYVLYTSGTTGLPKGVVRDTGGWAVALKYSMSKFYNCNPGDVFWSASDIGWVVGHAYIVYAPLLHGCTTILYEGKPIGTPDAGAFWRVISEHRVKAFFVAPTAFRAIKQADPNAELSSKYDLSCLETLFLAGEHCDPETIHWCERAVPHMPPPVDHWWQTECKFQFLDGCCIE